MARREPEDYERYARQVRRLFGFEYFDVPDAATVIFKTKKIGWIENYSRLDSGDMGSDEARYDQIRKLLEIREDIFVAANRNEPRARMTIWHELGHIVLGHKGIRHRNSAGRNIERVHIPTKLDEMAAKRFAAAFACPAYLVGEGTYPTTELLMRRFALSSEAACIRVRELHELRERSTDFEREIPAFVKDYLKEAKRRGAKVKTELD